MDTKFYIAVNGNQAGPYTFDQLRSQNVTPDTLVWFAGQPDWAKASTIPQLQTLFVSQQQPYQQSQQPQQPQYGQQPQQQYGQPQQPQYGQQQTYQQPQYGQSIYQQQNDYGMSQPMTNWLPWAIAATVCGFIFGGCIAWIFGILAINKANAAKKAYSYGDGVTAETENAAAKKWTIVALVVDAIGLVANIIILSSM